MIGVKLHFSRFEFKYVLPARNVSELEKDMRYFLEFDPFVRDIEGHYYDVRSLYFDDPAYSAFYNKIEGTHTRAKFRIRTYTNEAQNDTAQFLEIKGRYNNLVFKHRTQIGPEFHIGDDGEDEMIHKVVRATRQDKLGQRFEYELFRKRIRPIALVIYKRRPYVSRFDPDFRLTLDSDLTAVRARGLFQPGSGPAGRDIMPGYTVVEVKFRRHIPSWFHRLIQAHELRSVSVSKICKAMEVLELAEDPY